MKQIFDLHSILMRLAAGAGCAAGAAIVALLDRVTGINMDLSVFYFIPIALASIFLSRKLGFWLAVLSAILFFWANRQHYSDALSFAYINTGLHAVSFIVVSFVFSYIKEDEDKIEVLDRELAKTRQKLEKQA